MNLESYVKYLKTLNVEYQWPLERYNSRLLEREEIHKKFPFFVNYPGHYHGGILDKMEDWCRDNYGDRDGRCNWHVCPQGFDYWHKKTGLEDELDRLLDEISYDEGNQIIDKHFEMIRNRSDAPPEEHFHTGIWTSFFIIKTGYDYGYQDFCFKNKEDALHFKLIWDSEVERKK